VVETALGSATDLGTHFVVRAHAADSVLNVVVSEGQVALRPRRDEAQEPAPESVLLERGDHGRIAHGGQVLVQRNVPLDRYFAWTTGQQVFRDTPLAQAARELGRWYDLDVHIADPALEQKKLTASLQDESAAEVLQLLAALLDVSIEQSGKVVRIGSRQH
jgi:transmembrane sensor